MPPLLFGEFVGMTVFFVSDTHFNHRRIIDYCVRPFGSVKEMNQGIIERWNSIVHDDDTVFHLGDVYFFTNERENIESVEHDRKDFFQIMRQLRGHKFLIKGNHDTESDSVYTADGCFEKAYDYPILYDGFFMLSHEPLLLSQTTPYFNLYGHVHNDTRYANTSTSRCVCVERTDYAPISIEQIKHDAMALLLKYEANRLKK